MGMGSEDPALLLSGVQLDYAGESCDRILCWGEKSGKSVGCPPLPCYFEFIRLAGCYKASLLQVNSLRYN